MSPRRDPAPSATRALPAVLFAAMVAAVERPLSELDNAERDRDALEHWAALHHAVEQGPRTWSTCPGSDEHEALADAVERVNQVDFLASTIALLVELGRADDIRAAVLATAGEYHDYLVHLLARAADEAGAPLPLDLPGRQAGR